MDGHPRGVRKGFRGLSELFLTAPEQGDMGTICGQRQGAGQPDSAAATGNQRMLTGQGSS
jgi:hypothetical protein